MGPKADRQTSPRPHTPTSGGRQQTTPVGMMSWVSHDHLEPCSVFHLSLPSLTSHIPIFDVPPPQMGAASLKYAFDSVLTSEQRMRWRSICVRIGGRWATGEEQLWAALLTPDWRRRGQDGKQAQMQRPEQNSVWGKEEGHPVTAGRWRRRQQHGLCYWSFRKETKSQMTMTSVFGPVFGLSHILQDQSIPVNPQWTIRVISTVNIRLGSNESDIWTNEMLLKFSLIHSAIMIHRWPNNNPDHQISNDHLWKAGLLGPSRVTRRHS